MEEGSDLMTEEELDAMVEAEEKRLGVGSKEFTQRHNEIMHMIDEARQNGGKPDGTGSEDGNA